MSSVHVVDVNETNYQAELLEYSFKVPVIVDLWATWCGPCRTLGPILEKLADEYRGAFRLAKIDVDSNPNLAAAFRASSIPMVLALFEGGVVDQFVGARPRADVKRFVDGVLEKAGVQVGDDTPEVPTHPDKARAYWSQRLDKDPKNAEARLQLGRLELAAGHIDVAKSLLESLDATTEQYDAAQASLKLLELFEQVQQAGGEKAVRQALKKNPDDGRAKYLVACADATNGEFAGALQSLIDIVRSGPASSRDAAKQAASTILLAAGRDDDEVEAQRRRLATLLF